MRKPTSKTKKPLKKRVLPVPYGKRNTMERVNHITLPKAK
jgi:hypothetical protein